MKLSLVRTDLTDESSIGSLYIDGAFDCWTLEDTVRPDGLKVYGETAIPYGEYEVRITYSPRFKRDLPLVLDVANFSGVRIHPGNTAQDTEGCILVGRDKAKNRIGRSRAAFNALFSKMVVAIAAGATISLSVVSA